MSAATTSPEFHLHFEGGNLLMADHRVPAAALIQAAQALQRVVHLLAFHYEGGELKQRLRASRQMETKYAVIFGVPTDGGYDLPYQVGNPSQRLFDPQDIEASTGSIATFWTPSRAMIPLSLEKSSQLLPYGA